MTYVEDHSRLWGSGIQPVAAGCGTGGGLAWVREKRTESEKSGSWKSLEMRSGG
jgi:hypothetical protein